MTVVALAPGPAGPTPPQWRTLAIAVVLSFAAHAMLTVVPLATRNDARKALTRAGSAAAAITAVLLPARADAPETDPTPASSQPTLVTAPPVTRTSTKVSGRAGEPAPSARPQERAAETAAVTARVDPVKPRPVEGRVMIEDLGVIDAIATDSAAAAAIAPFRDSRADTPPRLPDTFLVGYPDTAFDSVMEGTQRVLVLINLEGRVEFLIFDQEHPWFGPTIEGVLRDAQFAPATRKGEPVPGWLALQFEFQIIGGGPEVEAMRDRAAVRVTP